MPLPDPSKVPQPMSNTRLCAHLTDWPIVHVASFGESAENTTKKIYMQLKNDRQIIISGDMVIEYLESPKSPVVTVDRPLLDMIP